MSKHTPGPWYPFYEGSGDYLICSRTDETEIASLSRSDAHFMGTGKGASINEANAKLIAAAPELLEALREIVSRNEIQHWFNLDQAKAAIAKAEGK